MENNQDNYTKADVEISQINGKMDLLDSKLSNTNTTVESFKTDTKKSLGDILIEIRGIAGRIGVVEAKQSLSDNNFTEFKIQTNNSIEALKRESSTHGTDITTLKDNQLLRRSQDDGKKEGLGLVWKVIIGIMLVAQFIGFIITFIVNTGGKL